MAASALLRCTEPIDGTIPVVALLYKDEHLLASQDGVGLYDGPNKSPAHQAGCIHVTSHRLFYISGASSASPLHAPTPTDERNTSLSLDLCRISRTESYAGFLTSSPKVTLHLHTKVSDEYNGLEGSSERLDADASLPDIDNTFDIWECEICGYRNPPGLSPTARSACGLCGMPRTASVTAVTPKLSTPRPDSVEGSDAYVPNPIRADSSQGRSSLGVKWAPSHLVSKPLPFSSTDAPEQSPLTLVSRDNMHVISTTLHPNEHRRRLEPSATACSACTFLNHPSLRECEICGTPLRRPSDETGRVEMVANLDHHSKSVPSTRPTSPGQRVLGSLHSLDIDEGTNYIKLSFRKGGDKAFYAALKTSLQKKEWEIRDHSWNAKWPTVTGFPGISGIIQNMDTTAIYTERGMSDAFADLEALMSKAQEMVRIAKGLNEQLTLATREAEEEPLEPEEAMFVRSSLGQLGLSMKSSAVTPDMSKDEKKYLEQLAIELAGVLLGSPGDRDGEECESKWIMKQRGIIGLDEVWGGWNRARGVSLISPEVTLKVLTFLPSHTTPPINTRALSSGLRVLHTPAYTISSFTARLINLLTETGPCKTTDIATSEGLSVGLVEELIAEVEQGGGICLDDPMGGTRTKAAASGGISFEVRWWVNMFNGYVWDGQAD